MRSVAGGMNSMSCPNSSQCHGRGGGGLDYARCAHSNALAMYAAFAFCGERDAYRVRVRLSRLGTIRAV